MNKYKALNYYNNASSWKSNGLMRPTASVQKNLNNCQGGAGAVSCDVAGCWPRWLGGRISCSHLACALGTMTLHFALLLPATLL